MAASPPGFLDPKARGPGFNLVRSLRIARDQYGRSLPSQMREMIRLARGPGRVNPIEFFQFRLFDDRAFDRDDKARFMGNAVRVGYRRTCVSQDWMAMTTDKVMFYAVLEGLGLPHPACRALYHPVRAMGSTRTLRDAAEVAAYLRREAAYPLFTKPVEGVGSAGVAAFTAYDAGADVLVSADGRRIGPEAFVAELERFLVRGYLFQERMAPEPALGALLGGRLSGVRCLVMMEDGRPTIYRATWKIPAGANLADNFWRPGNLVAAVDPNDGRVIRVVKGVGVDQTLVDDHPDTGGRLNGLVLPDWDRAKALALEAASSFIGLGLQGWDVALTDRGPVLLEVEGDGGAQTLTQYATGRGLLEDRFKAFLRSWEASSAARQASLVARPRRWVLRPTRSP